MPQPITTSKIRSTTNLNEKISNCIWWDPFNDKDHHRTGNRFDTGGFNNNNRYFSFNLRPVAFSESGNGHGRKCNRDLAGT